MGLQVLLTRLPIALVGLLRRSVCSAQASTQPEELPAELVSPDRIESPGTSDRATPAARRRSARWLVCLPVVG
jgi:hypothetical protein